MATVYPYSVEVLGDRAVIELRGDGVLAFLHNILTCSLEELNQGQLAYGALLSPQGKILHDVFIHERGGVIWLDCAVAQCEALIVKLKLYRLRAKFEIVSRSDLYVQVGGEGVDDPRHPKLGPRSIAVGAASGDAPDYKNRRFNLGIADSAEIGSGQLFPHEANFDLLGGVDFEKGCYIGQEVVSRMQHRSTTRSRILPVSFENGQPTDEIRVAESLLGEVLGRNGQQGLALIRLDRWAELGAPAGLEISKLDWMKL